MLRRILGMAVITCLVVAVAGMPVLAGRGPSDAGPPGQAAGGPPEFVLEMQQLRIAVMAQDAIRFRGGVLESDLPPVIKDGRVLLPVRAVANGLGADVDWDPDARMVTITGEDVTIVLYLDDLTCYVNDEPVEIDVPGQILGNRTFVPLRFIAQTLGVGVVWNSEDGTVDIIEIEGESDED